MARVRQPNQAPKRRRGTNTTDASGSTTATVTLDTDDDDDRDQDYLPSSSRPRARPRRLSYSATSPPASPGILAERDMRATSSDAVFRSPSPEHRMVAVSDDIRLTTTSSEARLQVQTFAAYVDRIANENNQSTARITALEAQVDTSREEVGNCNAIITTQRTELANAQRSIDTVRAENTTLQERLAGFQVREDDVKDIFYDDVAYDTARCPLPLTSGKYMGLETVMRYWLKSSYFDGKATSMFQCPLSRQLVRVQDMSVVKMVHDLASRIGINVRPVMYFQYDINVMPDDVANYSPRWEKYGIETQLHLMAALIALYRDRRFGAGKRTVQANDTHTVTMTRTFDSTSGLHDVKLELFVVWNGNGYRHIVGIAEQENAETLFEEFTLHATVVPEA